MGLQKQSKHAQTHQKFAHHSVENFISPNRPNQTPTQAKLKPNGLKPNTTETQPNNYPTQPKPNQTNPQLNQNPIKPKPGPNPLKPPSPLSIKIIINIQFPSCCQLLKFQIRTKQKWKIKPKSK